MKPKSNTQPKRAARERAIDRKEEELRASASAEAIQAPGQRLKCPPEPQHVLKRPESLRMLLQSMNNKSEHILRVLSEADVLLAEPGFVVEQRTVYGVHGDETDLAMSINWRDSTGCEWEAEFTEKALLDAVVEQNRITLRDFQNASVLLTTHRLEPLEEIGGSEN
jgi:hypothetical protein